jgi:hypothetical protein
MYINIQDISEIDEITSALTVMIEWRFLWIFFFYLQNLSSKTYYIIQYTYGIVIQNISQT